MRAVVVAGFFAVAACTVDVEQKPLDGALLSCSATSDCPSGMVCDGGAGLCRGLGGSDLTNGVACSTFLDCASAICEHGICCETECSDEYAPSCGRTGFCDSNPESAQYGRCAFYAAGTACHDPVCSQADAGSAGQYTAAQGCDGAGSACPTGTPGTCAGNVGCANATTCAAPCTVGTADGCPTGLWCQDVGGTPTCQANVRANGETCSLNTHCVSGNCNGGLCCTAGKACCNGSIANCPAAHPDCNGGCTAFDHTYVCGADFACQEQAAPSANSAFCNGDSCYFGAQNYCDDGPSGTCCQIICTDWGTCSGGYCNACVEDCPCC